jgi:hypothetical protein
VVFIYVSCMFIILLVGVELNHAVMKQDFHFSYVVVIHLGLCISFRCEMSGGNHATYSSVHIC